jgi:hypothetical protein
MARQGQQLSDTLITGARRAEAPGSRVGGADPVTSSYFGDAAGA